MPSPPDLTGSEQLSQWGESWGPSMQPLPKGPNLLLLSLPFIYHQHFPPINLPS